MSRREKQLVLALSLVIALTRLMALSRSMWDWDEGLFSVALHDYNVAAHHHPQIAMHRLDWMQIKRRTPS